ncbi:ATP-binding protein [Streptomyces triculaminicus]|uniref:ATP-binding protein n=1 Tax=Streptomyces triculaminicus TaxID=2816232 RepID=UPI0037D4DA20
MSERYGAAHQQALAAAVEAVLRRLDAHAHTSARPHPGPDGLARTPAAGPRQETASREDVAPGPAPEGGAPLDALAVVVSCFGLTPFERDVLVLAAAEQTDPTTGPRCAAACGDPARPHPTFALALAALDDPHWSALTPVGPLRRWRLIELDDETSPTTSRLRVDERILHFLVGVPYLDVRLHGLLRRRAPRAETPPPGHRDAVESVARVWTGAGFDGPPHAELVGADRATRWDIAATAAEHAGLALYTAAADDLPTDPAERDRLGRLWQREAILIPAALLIEDGDRTGERRDGAEGFLAELPVPVILSGDEPRPGGTAQRERVTVPPLTSDEQLHLWTGALEGVDGIGEQDVRDLVAQFSLPAHVIRSAGAAVRRAPGGDARRQAWRAGLAEARMSLDELGRRIEPRAGWEDLVLADRQHEILREAVAHVRRRATVYQEWGFESVLRRGLGVTALFAGGSGTGKTLAAEVVAGELGVDLFVIDLSQIVSKYIGETEKNLRKVFDAAERGGALLLFDEADALFGKRSEVKDSHDRYANLEVSYLLMRMEAYRGLAILTTNMKQALDQAFMRRIRFIVDFPFPGVPERAEIWRRVIPRATPSEDLDPDRLAQLTVAGGSIRNIALAAAFLAADEGSPLRMRHMLAAARTEYVKLERSLTPSEVRGWV